MSGIKFMKPSKGTPSRWFMSVPPFFFFSGARFSATPTHHHVTLHRKDQNPCVIPHRPSRVRSKSSRNEHSRTGAWLVLKIAPSLNSAAPQF